MNKVSIIFLGLAAGAIVGGGICLDLLGLHPAIASGFGAGVSAGIVILGLRRPAR